jgi:proteasome lid subunit RPN8/RPN11
MDGGGKMMRLPAAAVAGIREHALAVYPEECCGALIGRALDNHDVSREVVRAVRLENVRSDERDRRYFIPSDAVRAIERDAGREGLDVIGFYHSHPDHPAAPSAFDREHAWPWYEYLIVTVRRDEVGPVRVWRLADDRSTFHEEEVAVIEEDA